MFSLSPLPEKVSNVLLLPVTEALLENYEVHVKSAEEISKEDVLLVLSPEMDTQWYSNMHSHLEDYDCLVPYENEKLPRLNLSKYPKGFPLPPIMEAEASLWADYYLCSLHAAHTHGQNIKDPNVARTCAAMVETHVIAEIAEANGDLPDAIPPVQPSQISDEDCEEILNVARMYLKMEPELSA